MILTDEELRRISTDVAAFNRLPTEGESNELEEISPADLFEAVRTWITRYVLLGPYEATAIALWVMMTHALAVFDCVPYLSITSAEKQCGKTRLLEVLELVVANPWLTGRTTPAVLPRKIDKEAPTLLLDESDATFKGDKEFAETLRGILNTGYLRSGKTSLCVLRGKAIDYVDFSTFCPKAIAGIGSLPDTVADRSISIRLQRKLSNEPVDKFRRRYVKPEGDRLCLQLQKWATLFTTSEMIEPFVPDGLPDRAADICEPLLAIAEACGEPIPALARTALVALCGRQREDDSQGVQLLRDIRDILAARETDRIASGELATALGEIEESPWGPRFGKPFDTRTLARHLKPFNIKPKTIRVDDDDGSTTLKGYQREQFLDAWSRFAPLPSLEKPSQPSQPSQPNEIKASPTVPSVTKASQNRSPAPWAEVANVAYPPSHTVKSSRANLRGIRDVTHVTDVTVRGGEPSSDDLIAYADKVFGS
jgi:hypothetical protein